MILRTSCHLREPSPRIEFRLGFHLYGTSLLALLLFVSLLVPFLIIVCLYFNIYLFTSYSFITLDLTMALAARISSIGFSRLEFVVLNSSLGFRHLDLVPCCSDVVAWNLAILVPTFGFSHCRSRISLLLLPVFIAVALYFVTGTSSPSLCISSLEFCRRVIAVSCILPWPSQYLSMVV
jgi:hypothetical protein